MSFDQSKIKGVIFDLDGTLINSISDIHDSLNKVLAQHKHPLIDLETCTLLVGNGLKDLVKQALPPSFRTNSYVITLVNEMRDVYAKRWLNKTCLYDGIAEMLNDLSAKGYLLSVLSNKSQASTSTLVSLLLAKWSFQVVAGEIPDRPLKPHPASVQFVLDEAGFSPDEMLFIGDGETDVIAAKSVSMKVIAVSWGYRRRKLLARLKPDLIVDHPNELSEIL